MKFWTMLAGLAVAGILVSSAFAQEDAPKKKGRGRMQQPPTYQKLVDAKAINDGDPVTLDKFTTYLVGAVPSNAKEGTADRVKANAPTLFGRIATAAGQDAAATSLTKDQYNDGLAKMPAKKSKKKSDNNDAPAPTGK
jgi:hypothetical protein